MLKAMDSISSGVMRGTSLEAVEQPVDAKIGVVADLQVQVGGPAVDGAAQKIVNVDGHSNNPVGSRSSQASMRPRTAINAS